MSASAAQTRRASITSSTSGRRCRTTWVPLAAVLAVVAGCAMPPAQPTQGLGAKGPCTQTVQSAPNPAASGQTLNVYLPGGSAAAAVGGRCDDDRRPTAIVVHGLFAGMPWLYADTISHLVSTGNVVIFATYETNAADFVGSFQKEDAAIVAAAGLTGREDVGRVGIIGHSMGGGAVPYLVQRIAARGWGTEGLWAMSLAPWRLAGVEPTGPIAFPANAHVVVEAYSDDVFVPRSTGVDLFTRITTPASRKQHVTLNTATYDGATLSAAHTTPNSGIAPEDAMRFFGIYRIADALQGCSQRGVDCDTDFSVMGAWSDGTPVKPATSTDAPAP